MNSLFQSKNRSKNKYVGNNKLKRWTANILTNYIIETFNKYKLSYKIIAFSGDNCNANFRVPKEKEQICFFISKY